MTSSWRSKEVKVKLSVDGAKVRLVVEAKGLRVTKSFDDTTSGVTWLTEQLDDQLRRLQEAANGTTR